MRSWPYLLLIVALFPLKAFAYWSGGDPLWYLSFAFRRIDDPSLYAMGATVAASRLVARAARLARVRAPHYRARWITFGLISAVYLIHVFREGETFFFWWHVPAKAPG